MWVSLLHRLPVARASRVSLPLSRFLRNITQHVNVARCRARVHTGYCAASGLAERIQQVGDQIVGVLDTDR